MTKPQRIAMLAGDLELDRAEVIYAVTGGTKTSGTELEEAEADLVLDALRRLKAGELRLEVDDDDAPTLVEAPPVPNGPDDDQEEQQDPATSEEEAEELDPLAFGAEVDWDQDQWIAYLKSHSIRMVPVLKYAKGIAAEQEAPIPTSLGALRGNASLAALTRAHVEEQIEGA